MPQRRPIAVLVLVVCLVSSVCWAGEVCGRTTSGALLSTSIDNTTLSVLSRNGTASPLLDLAAAGYLDARAYFAAEDAARGLYSVPLFRPAGPAFRQVLVSVAVRAAPPAVSDVSPDLWARASAGPLNIAWDLPSGDLYQVVYSGEGGTSQRELWRNEPSNSWNKTVLGTWTSTFSDGVLDQLGRVYYLLFATPGVHFTQYLYMYDVASRRTTNCTVTDGLGGSASINDVVFDHHSGNIVGLRQVQGQFTLAYLDPTSCKVSNAPEPIPSEGWADGGSRPAFDPELREYYKVFTSFTTGEYWLATVSVNGTLVARGNLQVVPASIGWLQSA